MVDLWGTILAPQPWTETHLKFYYQLQATVDEQITKVLDALEASSAYENTIVVFTSDHGDLQGAHNGMHEKWHCAYEEALHVPFVVSSPLLPGGARELDVPTSHADLIPTLLGLAGIDQDEALAKRASRPQGDTPVDRARPLRRDPGRRARGACRADPVHDRRRDQRGQRGTGQPVPESGQGAAPVRHDRPAEPPGDRHRRGRRRRGATPRQVQPLPRQPAVLDRAGRARRAHPQEQDVSRSQSPSPTSTSSTT